MKDPAPTRTACEICGRADAPRVAARSGRRTGAQFHIRYCAGCGFAWVDNPWVDFAAVYDEAYYRGQGSDPLIEYVDELENIGQTLRRWEWRGILELARENAAGAEAVRWLDFGCGNGGLVKYGRDSPHTRGWVIEGFEEGWAADFGRGRGIPILERAELAGRAGSYDLITAVEVMEHTLNPLEVLREVRELLRPGGRFLFTTGNLAPFAGEKIAQWGYTMPEIHISYFEPRAMAVLLERAGFRVEYPGYRPAHNHVIAYKILKTLGHRHERAWMRLAPWRLLSRLAESRARLTDFPIGIAV